MEYNYYSKLASRFDLKGEILSIEPLGNGHINNTFLVKTTEKQYILQSINPVVFRNTEQLMQNVQGITSYLRDVIRTGGGDPERETLTVIPTCDGHAFLRSDDGTPFRVYNYITDTVTYQTVKTPEDFYFSAKAFGRFADMLSEYPAETLYETIPAFHNTKIRYYNLIKAIQTDKVGRGSSVLPEIDFAMKRVADAGIIVDAIELGKIPLRVCHNDTKLNNLLIDRKTGMAICVVDLDTVMPGTMLYDFGDAIRFGANPAAEDEKDLSKVCCNLSLFEAYVKGYLEELHDSITQEEISLLPISAKLMTLECGVRFLTDYLEGDVYFKTADKEQNLDRCRTQFRLVDDMERKMDDMKAIVDRYRA